MKDNAAEHEWMEQLRHKPLADGKFTIEMWDNVESKLLARHTRQLMKSLLMAGCAVLVVAGFLFLVPAHENFSIRSISTAIQGTGSSDIYDGIESYDIPEIANNRDNLKFLYEYRGHTDNWAAVITVYQMNGEKLHYNKLLVKYIGEGPHPTGLLAYESKFNGVDINGGYGGGSSGSYSNAEWSNYPAGSKYDNPSQSIYGLGTGGTDAPITKIAPSAHLLIKWNGEDYREELDLMLQK